MVNVNRFIRWIYNKIFNADEKRNTLKERCHYCCYQNSNTLSDNEKNQLVKLSEQVQLYNRKLQSIKEHYERYKRKKVGG